MSKIAYATLLSPKLGFPFKNKIFVILWANVGHKIL